MPKKKKIRQFERQSSHDSAATLAVDVNPNSSVQMGLGQIPEESPVGMATLDRRFRFLYVNPELARISGQTAAAHRGRSVGKILRFMTPTLEPLLKRVIRTGQQVLHTKISGRRGRRFKGADDWLVSCIPRVEAGQTQQIQLMIRAVGQRQRSRTRGRENEEEFRSLAESTPVMIWQTGKDKECTYVNQRWVDFTGRPMREQLGHGWVQGVHPEDRERCVETYVGAFDARAPFTMEYRLRRYDQEYRWILDSGAPWHDRNGRFAGYLGSCIDITERRQAGEFFRQVVEAIPNAIVLVGVDGHIRRINDRTEQLFGYSREELVGQPVEILVPEHYRAELPNIRENYFSNPSSRNIGVGRDLSGVHKNGHEIPIEIVLSPIKTEDGVQVLASIIDVTDRRLAQLEVQENQAELAHMRRVSTVGELAASIAHELNQPLTAILSNTQAAIRFLNLEPPDLNEIKNILKDVAADDKRAGEVIRRLRGLLKRKELELGPLAVNEVVNSVADMLRSAAIIRKASIVTDLEPELPLAAGDEIQLQQVLLNLILNGLDAMAETPPGRRIVLIRTYMPNRDIIQVSILDQGRGISKQHLGSIFRPFFTTKKEGLGMGLAVAHSIIEGHKGRLWAENNLDKGAVFHFTLPMYSPEQKENTP